MRLTPLPGYRFERQRWANARGWTREIHREPEGADAYAWRASIAEIDVAGPFSTFAGCRRTLVLLEGSSLLLRVDGVQHRLLAPWGRIDFDGEAAVECELPDGPVRAFNLIHDPRRTDAEILLRPLVGPMVFFAEPGQHWLLLLWRGQCTLKQPRQPFALAAGDALLLSGDEPGDRRAIIDGGGDLLLVNLRARHPA
jgi:uncharacterized protein